MDETRYQIARLTRATAARARCQEQATRAAARGTLAQTPQARGDWQDLALEARRNRDLWDAEIRTIRQALLADA
jgi:hypothetical protein